MPLGSPACHSSSKSGRKQSAHGATHQVDHHHAGQLLAGPQLGVRLTRGRRAIGPTSSVTCSTGARTSSCAGARSTLLAPQEPCCLRLRWLHVVCIVHDQVVCAKRQAGGRVAGWKVRREGALLAAALASGMPKPAKQQS